MALRHRPTADSGGTRSRRKPAPWMRPAAARVSSLMPGAGREQPDAFDGERYFIRSNN